jgi:excisionase family DNA binding protein
MMGADNPLVLTIDQVAELLQVPASVVGRLRNQRKIAFVKVGGALRFRIEDIRDYLERARQPCANQDAPHGSDKKTEDQTSTSSISMKLPDGLNDAAAALAIAAKLKKNSVDS